MSEDEKTVLDKALADCTKRGRERILLDRSGLGNYRPVNPLITSGDIERVRAEFRKAEAQPGFMFEIQFTNWSNALDRAYPGYSTYILASRPSITAPNKASVEFYIGPPDSVHGGRRMYYQRKKIAGKWLIQTPPDS
jgi:hypothetical protein